MVTHIGPWDMDPWYHGPSGQITSQKRSQNGVKYGQNQDLDLKIVTQDLKTSSGSRPQPRDRQGHDVVNMSTSGPQQRTWTQGCQLAQHHNLMVTELWLKAYHLLAHGAH